MAGPLNNLHRFLTSTTSTRHLATHSTSCANLIIASLLLGVSTTHSRAQADGLHNLPEEIILIRGTKLVRQKAAQDGQINLATEPTALLRPADVLENVPGLVVTQHSGSGKANQYFLRGFNLDHGTDFATQVDGMAVNARSHGHGQGYTDLNFLIPELLGQLDYQKGPGHAQHGDFASAGSAELSIRDQAPSQLGVSIGAFGYRRLLAVSSQSVGQGQWLNALEAQHYNGPWQGLKEQVQKYNLWSRYSLDTVQQYFSLTLMAYQNDWNSADQIPQRLIDAGQSRFIALDNEQGLGGGGKSDRYSLSLQWLRNDWEFSAYALQSRLDLWSNFTYFLENPELGDQFYQLDDRRQWGAELSRQQSADTAVGQWQHQYGVQYRHDKIAPIELAHSQQRQRLQSLKLDQMNQWSIAAFSQQQWQLSDNWSAELGSRYDWLDARVNDLLFMPSHELSTSNNTALSTSADGIASVRTALIYRTAQQSWSLSYAQGMHSNDARSLSRAADSDTSFDGRMAVQPDNSLWARTEHSAISWQASVENWQYSASLWHMRSDQEWVYVADAAETELKGASQRYGFEGTLAYQWNHQWSTSVDIAQTSAEFKNTADGRYIEGSVPRVVMAKLQYHSHDNLAWQMKIRHLGPRYLDSSGIERGSSVTQLSLQLSGSFHFAAPSRDKNRTETTTAAGANTWQWQLELHNALNSHAADVQYFYESRLANEAAAVADRHLHPVEPRMLRASLSYLF